MIGIVLAAHYPLGRALAHAAEHVFGAVPRLVAIDVIPDTSMEKIRQQLLEAVTSVDSGDGVLILTDLFGATPSNIASQLADARIKVVAGVNLPMLLRSVSYRTETLNSVAEKAASGGAQGIVQVGSKVPQKQATMPDSNSLQQHNSYQQKQQQQQQ
jgi:PTS system mannose-specific IIA component